MKKMRDGKTEQLRLFPEISEQEVFSPGSAERQRIEKKFAPLIVDDPQLGQLVSYVGNKSVPVLRLYRYKEAFAYRFVDEMIHRLHLTEDDYVFDPFCGMGTTLFTARQRGISAIGIDRLPIATFVAQTLPLFFSIEPQTLSLAFDELKAQVAQTEPAAVALDVKIMQIAFPDEVLMNLRRWKAAIDNLESPLHDIFLLLFLSILEPCSYTSKDGQFLRLNTSKRIADPAEILHKKVYEAEQDIMALRLVWKNSDVRPSQVQLADARNLESVAFQRPPTAIITSPPYANRYDYTRTYSLELCFHFVKNFDELKALRLGILRSHIEAKVYDTDRPPHPVIEEVVTLLRQRSKELNNPRVPDMLTSYFVDMEQVINQWGAVLAPGAQVAMVVDNVRFQGELVPVDLVLSEMAEKAGFRVKQIMVARYKGNSSQQMGRYGKVPVRESVVVWEKGT